MKKFLKVLLAIVMIVVLFTLPTVALADTGTQAPAAEGLDLLINFGLQIAETLLITLIGVLGTWLTLQLNKNAKLKNINDAQKELIRAAKITVGELKQTTVDALKAGHSDGKLTLQEIAQLREKLRDKTLEKLSAPAYALLAAASVDVEGLIIGVGESWIERLKQSSGSPDTDTE